MENKFYIFDQNNSGGSFKTDDKLCCTLFIEANSSKKANYIARQMGVYFDGCDAGLDCSCCGDRWSKRDDGDSKTYPLVYSERDRITFDGPEQHAQYLSDGFSWTKPDARIFYADGRVVEINGKKRER